jgi:hypothetical protein
LKRQAIEIKRSAERTLLLGSRQDASSTAPYMMGGIGYYISEHVQTKSGAIFTEADFLAGPQSVLDDAGPDMAADTVLVNTLTKQIISSWVDALAAGARRGTRSSATSWTSGRPRSARSTFLYAGPAFPTDEMWGVNFDAAEPALLRGHGVAGGAAGEDGHDRGRPRLRRVDPARTGRPQPLEDHGIFDHKGRLSDYAGILDEQVSVYMPPIAA